LNQSASFVIETRGAEMIWKTSQKQTRVKPKPRVKLELLGLAPREELVVSIEEIRRQGLMLADRSIGQGSRPVPPPAPPAPGSRPGSKLGKKARA
jgi:hypothetical protein